MGIKTVIIIAILVLIYIATRETFTTKREKATAIYDWFARVRVPQYADFRRALGGKSNIVEYEDVLRLFGERNLTVASVESVI